MQEHRAEVVVVGLGVAGEAVAGTLAKAGVDVVGIEAELVGGECPYWGCIPTKMMIRAANLLAEARRIPGIAGGSSVTPDWSQVAQRIREEATDTWDDTAAVKRFVDAGGRFVRGRAEILGPDRVEVPGEGAFVATRALVLATGTEPSAPPIDGLDATPYWTNRQAVEAETLPGSLLVVGGGAIGLEFAQAYQRFGVEVTVVEAADRLLAMEEPEASAVVTEVLTGEGIRVHRGTKVERVEYDDGFVLRTSAGELSGDRLLVATGRRPRLSAATASALGVEPDGALVDERMRVRDGVWAVGDVTGHGAFTHVATYQADVAARDILGEEGPPADYRALPRVTFTDPEVGAVGLTEAQARERGIAVRTGVASVGATTRGWIHKAGNDGLLKLVADADSGVLVGATSAGPHGGEVLGALAVAVHGRVPVAALAHMIYAYPTFHRGILDAVRDLGL